jgi:hypothetical protein
MALNLKCVDFFFVKCKYDLISSFHFIIKLIFYENIRNLILVNNNNNNRDLPNISLKKNKKKRNLHSCYKNIK